MTPVWVVPYKEIQDFLGFQIPPSKKLICRNSNPDYRTWSKMGANINAWKLLSADLVNISYYDLKRITILSYSLLLLTYCAEITKGEDKRAIARCTDLCSTYSNCQGFDAYGEYFIVYGRCPSGLVCCYYYKYSIDEWGNYKAILHRFLHQ